MESNQLAEERCGLVVDDNSINRRVAAAMLKRLGYIQIVEAENGLKALELVKSRNFDLILMDCEMPVMDGLESTRQIRLWESDNCSTGSTIVALTARVLQGDRERCLAAGMNDYLTKPIQIEMLQAVIKNRGERDMPASLQAEWNRNDDISVIDDLRYEKMCALLREGVHEFYHDYLTATRLKLDEIQSRPDMPPETSARLIHSIRGSAANVGAAKLHLLAGLLERRLEAGDSTVLHKEIASLQEAVSKLESQIVERLG